MAFLTGGVTFLRFEVQGKAPEFDETLLERLALFAAGRQRLASADGVECGWTASQHVLDTRFTLEKNVCDDALLFDLRIDTDKLPGDLLKAYYEVELAALSANNPSGFPSMRQKREAREAARNRLEDEAKDGRFKKRKCVPIMWDRRSGELLFGSTSVTHVDRLCALFNQTFGFELSPMTAANCVPAAPESASHPVGISRFVEGVTPDQVAWIPDENQADYLGNEFLLWLWFGSDGESDTVELADDSDATYMIAKKLILDCPRGMSGTDGFRHDGPSKLPEAKRALKAGKLPRQCGLILVRHDEQYEFVLHAETLGVGSAKMPKPQEGDQPRTMSERRVERLAQVRHFVETLDLLYSEFLSVRLGAEWPAMLARIQKWIANPERREAA